MKKFLQFIGVYKDSGKVVLNETEKEEFSALSSKRFIDLNQEDQRRFLEIGAKDFSKKFSGVIKDLSRE